MNVDKTLAALQKVVTALAELDAEQRRQVLEAVHTLLPVGMGRAPCDDEGCDDHAPEPPAARPARPRRRR